MNLPLTLEKLDPPAASDAFLLLDHAAEQLGECVAGLSVGGQPPRLFRVRGGHLFVPPAAAAFTPPGAVRLRRIAPHFFIPVDAVLSPAVLPDEFHGLTRGGGLVLLPSGPLAFDPTEQIPPTAWLVVPDVRAEEWSAFPPIPPGADTLRSVERPSPPQVVAEILGGEEPDGLGPLSENIPEDARPPKGSSAVVRAVAGGALGVAGVLAWLGKALGLGGLARAAADMARKAIEQVPRLSERVLGEQEAALRELLRQLQGGDVETALRRAPIAVPDPDARGTADAGSRLDEHSTGYSLADLLRGGGVGVGSVWAGGGDVWEMLRAQYRRMAEEAVKRGDYRRAAYLWGVLLRDLRTAANVLRAGGRHRDAAVILRDKLSDPLGAAACFELAGDFDEAVRLYQTCGEDVQAGDLLRKIGDDTRAEACYLNAATQLAARHEHLQAGDLIRTKTGRHDLACDQYLLGWRDPRPNAVVCGQRLLDDVLMRGEADELDELVADATARLAPPRSVDAGRFFNYALRAAPGLLSEDRLADLQDLVRVQFAAHLCAGGSGTGRVKVDTLFDREWPAAVRRDAAVAVARLPEAPAVAPPVNPLVAGKVRTVAVARAAGVVFVGTNESVTAWNVRTGSSGEVVQHLSGELFGLCVSADGRNFYTLVHRGGVLRLTSHALKSSETWVRELLGSADIPCEDPASAYLQPNTFADLRRDFLVVAVDGVRQGYHTRVLSTSSAVPFDRECDHSRWIAATRDVFWDWADGDLFAWRQHEAGFSPVGRWTIPWVPAAGVGGQPRLDWALVTDGGLVLAGIDAEGTLHRTEVSLGGAERTEARHQSATYPGGYSAVTVLPGGWVTAAARSTGELFTMRRVGSALVPCRPSITLPGGGRVAHLMQDPVANVLAAVTAGGQVTTVPWSA